MSMCCSLFLKFDTFLQNVTFPMLWFLLRTVFVLVSPYFYSILPSNFRLETRAEWRVRAKYALALFNTKMYDKSDFALGNGVGRVSGVANGRDREAT